MKKIVTILLALCVLAASTAFAADMKVGVDPYALEGLDFILMEDRFTQAQPDTCSRMQLIYEAIHDTDHFGELPVMDHLNGVGADVNRELAEMNLALTVYDYLIYDSFELELQPDYAHLLENGNVLEMQFDMNLERSVHPVVLLNNGQAWKCLPHEQVQLDGSGVLKVRFDELGTVLVLVEVENKQPGSADYNGNFTPSVTGKAAPDVIAPDKNDPNTIALIYNELNELISRVPDTGYLVVTPVSRREVAQDKQVRERLEWAYNQIRTTPRIGDLPVADNASAADAIQAVLNASGFADFDSDDLIVRDLFDASLYGTEYVDALNDEGHYIEIIFDLKVSPNDPLVILLTNDNRTWQVLDWSAYEINPDGSVTVRLQEMGTLAILVDAENQVADANGVKSPKTGE